MTMRIPQPHLWLPLLSILTSPAIASALPPKPHNHVPTIREQNTAALALSPPPPPSPHQRRIVHIGTLVPGNPDARIAGLPQGWSGIFTDITALQPSTVVAALFIHFFKSAAEKVARSPLADRWIQRVDGGSLILEMWNEDPKKIVTRELLLAVLLWLLHAAQRGWTGFFVARLRDRVSREWFVVRLVNPKMLPA